LIRNLAKYNAWKRTTLDRLSSKFTVRMRIVLDQHAKTLEPFLRAALEAGAQSFNIPDLFLKQQLIDIFLHHQHDAVYVAISDGIREMSPKKKLSTWEKWPYDYPVEATFTSLAERKERDSIASKVFKSIRKRNNKIIGDLIDLEVERYKRNVRSVFHAVADQYFKDPENTAPKGVFVDLLGRIFNKNEVQATAVFRTETTRYFNDARIAYFQDNTDVDFVQIVAVTDGRISNICESRDGYVIPIDRANEKQFRPPFHINCRSVQSPLDTDLKSDLEIVRSSLGSEFGKVHSETSDRDFTGRRQKPSVPLPKGWA
jgi:SPP1 gp7 family putative phage head morphogenesis protein